MKRSFRARLALAAATTAASTLFGSASSARAASTSWLNAGSDWFDSANWTSGVPTASVDAILPASIFATNPTVNTEGFASGLVINNSSGEYWIDGVSSLTLGANGLQITGGGSTNIAPTVAIGASTSFNIGAGVLTTLNGPLAAGSLTLTKSGSGTVVFNSNSSATSGMSLVINDGVVKVTRSNSLGTSPQVTVNSGGVFQIDVPTPPTGDLNFGDTGMQLTLNNGGTLRGGGQSPNVIVTLQTSTSSPAVTNGANVTIDVPENDDQLLLKSAVRNTVDAPLGTSSVIHVTGNGVLQLDAPATAPGSYSGNWNIDHSIIGNEAGATLLNSIEGFGVRTGGVPASVTLTSGFLIDVRSTSGQRVQNPMTFNGGYLNTSATLAGISRTGAFFSGTMTINNVPDGSGIDMEDLFASPKNLNTTLSGQINGSGLLYIFAAIGAPSVGVLSLTNVSMINPNTASGTFSVTNFAALDATTGPAGSDPLGTATVSLSGGSLRLTHQGSGSNGVISAFAANNIEVYALDTAFGDQNGTITVGSGGSGNTGNVVQLGALSFNGTGASANQTLTTNNAVGGVNYKLRFSGMTTLAGNSTFTSGATPADVELAGKITGTGNLIKAGNNTLTLSGVSSDYTGATTVNAGTLVFNTTHKIHQLNIANAARAIVSSGGDKVLATTGISITGSGKLDMTDEDGVVDYSGSSPLAAIKTLIANGFAGGAWSGNGITSSAAAATVGSQHTTGLGYGESSVIFNSFPANFSGADVDSTAILIRYTAFGDANLDGSVDTTDFNNLASNFSGSGKFWPQGDFNYDGTVDTTDFNLLASNFSFTVSGPQALASSLVPEPAISSSLAICLALTRRRKWRS